MKTTKIQWADATFNPWIGCTKVSPGCKNCYAENTTRARVLRSQGQETWGKGAKRSRTSAATWRQPLKWNKKAGDDVLNYLSEVPLHDEGQLAPYVRPRVFPSLCDWLDDEVPIEWLGDFLQLIHDTPHLDWLLLTKRPENWRKRLTQVREIALESERWVLHRFVHEWMERLDKLPPHQIWIGTSVEDQQRADERIPALLKIRAKLRFLSLEPLLRPLELDKWFWDLPEPICEGCPKDVDCECGFKTAKENGRISIDWVIFGGESGHGARPCNIEWIRDGVKQCQSAGVAAFAKQLGENIISRNDAGFEGESKTEWPMDTHWAELDPAEYQGAPVRVHLKDKKGGDMAEWPEDLRVREFPKL